MSDPKMNKQVQDAVKAAIIPAQAHMDTPAVSQKPVYEVSADAIEKNRNDPHYIKIMTAYNDYLSNPNSGKKYLIASLDELNHMSAEKGSQITGQLLLDAATKLNHPSLLIAIGQTVDGAKDMQFKFPGENPENLHDLLTKGHVSPHLNIPKWEAPHRDMANDIIHAMNKHSMAAHQATQPAPTPAKPADQPPHRLYRT